MLLWKEQLLPYKYLVRVVHSVYLHYIFVFLGVAICCLTDAHKRIALHYYICPRRL